jgi:hypothetical protein
MSELEPQEEQRCGRGAPKGAIAAAAVAAALGAVAFSRTRQRVRLSAHQQALRELAEETGCQFTPAQPNDPQGPDFPTLEGLHRDRQVRLDTEVAGASLGLRLLTRATARHSAPVPGFVVIREETLTTRMADHLGLADIQVGEPAFDDRFEVTSDVPEAADLLQPEVRDALMGATFESVVIRPGEVIVRQRGPLTTTAALRQTLKLAVDIAEWLETLG